MYTALLVLPSIGVYPAMKPGGFFCRAIDDMADGDLAIPANFANFAEWATELESTIKGDSQPSHPLALVMLDAISKFESVASEDDNVKATLTAFLAGMTLDNERRVRGKTLSWSEILNIYDLTFLPPIQLSLIGLRSSNRASDIPLLGQVQGRIYAIRDFAHELPLGVINIPENVITASGLSGKMLMDTPNLVNTNSVTAAWIQAELRDCVGVIDTLRLTRLDKNARNMTDLLINPIDRYIHSRIK